MRAASTELVDDRNLSWDISKVNEKLNMCRKGLIQFIQNHLTQDISSINLK